MADKGFPTHLLRKVQSMYRNTTIIIRKDRVNDNTPIQINKGVRQGCPLYCLIFTLTKSSKIGCRLSNKTF
jgi:hypothetical protein